MLRYASQSPLLQVDFDADFAQLPLGKGYIASFACLWYLFFDESSSLPFMIGLAGEHQYVNAALAVALVSSFSSSLRSRGQAGWIDGDWLPTVRGGQVTIKVRLLPRLACDALNKARWPLACCIAPSECLRSLLFFDNAHTAESIKATGKWFAKQRKRYINIK